jgi:hypothetical protein
MDAAEFLVVQHGRLHAADVTGPGSIISHNAMHLGEAVAIRGQLGLPVGM